MNWLFRRNDPRSKTGGTGEDAAVAFYRKLGATILSRNFRCTLGEIDLVVELAGVIVFVEVKTASAAGGIAPELRVGADKQRRLTRLAEFYIAHKKLAGRSARFDVLAVVLDPAGGEPTFTHYANAFAATR